LFKNSEARYAEIGIPIHCQKECNMLEVLWQETFQHMYIFSLFYKTNQLLGIYLNHNQAKYEAIDIQDFYITVALKRAKDLKQLKCQFTVPGTLCGYKNNSVCFCVRACVCVCVRALKRVARREEINGCKIHNCSWKKGPKSKIKDRVKLDLPRGITFYKFDF
jgi:hypothetical protein